MIQAITESAFNAYLSTEDNRINTSVASTQIRHLFKFINDMDGSVEYYYAATETIYNRYTKFEFNYNVTEDLYAGATKMLPAGHWKYEVYEVSWIGAVVVAFGTAPSTETEVLPVADTNGVVQGIVTKGIMYLDEKSGTEQVQYNQHTEPEATNYIWYGQDDSFKPTDLPGGTLDIVASFERNTNIESDENAAGATLDPVHSTAAGTMEDGDKISKWSHSQWTGEDYSPVLVQTTSAEKPYWDTSMPGGSPRFLSGNFFDGLTTSNGGKYTIYIRVNFDSLLAAGSSSSGSSLIGDNSENTFSVLNANSFILNTNDSGRIFIESSNTIKTGIWYTLALQRTATNDVNVYVNGGEYSDKSWGDTAAGETGTFVTTQLGAAVVQTTIGFISDLFYYAGDNHTAADRAKMYNYLG